LTWQGDNETSPLEPATPSLHIGETDCVAGHIGLELRRAK
jgi:hypothetical protein